MPTFHLPHTRSEHLDACREIEHGFFGRKGGISTGIYESLNAGPGSDDAPDAIAENRERVRKALRAEQLVSLYQIHSPNVITLTDFRRPEARIEGDGMVTAIPGLALCVLTADCTPVLIADPWARVVGAAHAGWKGALAGVIENTIEAMTALGAAPDNMIAAIGPSLSQTSFEVGPDLKTPFVEKHPWSERFFASGASDRSQFDIWRFCEGVLLRAGVRQVDIVGEDTLSQPNRYFSNRWRVQQEHSDYGRNASVIMIK